MTDINQFKARFEIECRKAGLSLSEVARRLGKAPQTLHLMVQRGNPRVELLSGIAAVLGCTVEQLLAPVTPEEYGTTMLPRAS